MKQYKGFTLIELLVVIAIIGILASVLLISLNQARNKAKDVAAQAILTQVRNIIILEENPTNICPHVYSPQLNSIAGNLIVSAVEKVDQPFIYYNTVRCIGFSTGGSNPFKTWAISIVMTDGTTSFCIDSDGFIGTGRYAWTVAGVNFCTQ